MTFEIEIRNESSADVAAIEAVTIAAFLNAPHTRVTPSSSSSTRCETPDNWLSHSLRIPKAPLWVMSPCLRCQYPTVRPDGSGWAPSRFCQSIRVVAWGLASCAKLCACFESRARRAVNCLESPSSTAALASGRILTLFFQMFRQNTFRRSRSARPGRRALFRTTRPSMRRTKPAKSRAGREGSLLVLRFVMTAG